MIEAVLIALLIYAIPVVGIVLYGLYLVVIAGLIEAHRESVLDGFDLLKLSPVWPVFVKRRYDYVMKGTDS